MNAAVGMAEWARVVYRTRRPGDTAFYCFVEGHHKRFKDRYGFFRPVIRETVYKSLG